MIAIEIEYKPLSFLPWKKRIRRMFPVHWSEMTANQVAAVPKLIRGELTVNKLLKIFLGLERRIAAKLDNYQKFVILRELKYIHKPEAVGNFVIKEIAGYRSPGDKLEGVIFGAFIFAEHYYDNYKKGKIRDMDRFIACFYSDKKGFDQNTIELKAKKITQEPFHLREAIMINYGLIREWLEQAYPYVFQKREKEEKGTNKGWIAVFDKIVGDDLVNQEKYALLPASSVLRYLNNKVKEYYKNGGKVK